MRIKKRYITPLAAVAGSLLADRRHRHRVPGHRSVPDVSRERHERLARVGIRAGRDLGEGPDPGQAAKRVIEGFTQRKLDDRLAWPISTAAHWAYGSSAAAPYGILAGSLRRPHALYGLLFGVAVWATGYVVLPEAGLYKPIWEYDAKTLASDLSAHLACGAGTGAAFWLFTKIGGTTGLPQTAGSTTRPQKEA
jgi:hypothetical protein